MGRIFVVIGISLVLLGACEKQVQKQAPPLGGGAFLDDEGTTITVEQPFRRIIPLYSAHTENLFAIGAGDFVIGGHKTCTYPAQADLLPKFDYTGDPEYIIAESPDLVLIRPFIRRAHPSYLAELEKAGIVVVSLYPERMVDFDGYIRRLALLTGKEAAAEEKLRAFHETVAGISSRTEGIADKPSVFFESTATENRTVAAASLPAHAIALVNARNIAADAQPVSKGSSIASFGAEKLLQNADSIDAYIVQQGAMNRAKTLADLLARPGFGTVKAIREKRVLFIDEKLISSPTFRYSEGVAQIAAFLYPEVFIP